MDHTLKQKLTVSIPLCFLTFLLLFSGADTVSGTSSGFGEVNGDFSGSGTSGPTDTTYSPFNPLVISEDYFPFLDLGEEFGGRLGELGRTLDGCSNPVYMNEGIPFGSATETEMRVCSNGIISFGKTPFYWWFPEPFPTRYSFVESSNVVALFWNDHDNRRGSPFTSQVLYQAFRPDLGQSARAYLSNVSEFVSYQTNQDFEGVWMLVAHWIDSPPYPVFYYQFLQNSYQAIIITDGMKTYAVFTYNCEMLNWVGFYRYSVVGYHINSKSARSITFPSFMNHPLSGYPEIGTVACSNLVYGVSWSNLVYQIGMATDRAQTGRADCLKRAVQEISLAPLLSDAPCPCSFWQAIFDSRYSYASRRLATITGDPAFYNSLCYVQRFPPFRSNTGVHLCCYSIGFNFGALLDSSYGYEGSSLLRHHPFWETRDYLRDDYPFRESCCFDGGICEVYTRLRPADNCARYRPPRRAWCWGDPHITNLDGGVFTFNGWGEYTLLDIQTSETSFILQGRTHPVEGGSATELVALAFGLSKYSPVEVRLSGDPESPLLVFFEGVDILANISSTNDTFEHQNATVTRGSLTSLVCSFPNGIGMIVNATTMLGFTLIVPEEYRAISSGLSGNYNGDPTDDVAFRNGTMLPHNVSARVLHEVGLSWSIDTEDSLFTYPEGMTANDFQHPEHVPVFLDEVLANASQEVIDACGDNFDCIFDASQTGDISVGIASMFSNQQNVVEQEMAANTPPKILGPRVLYITLGETAELVFNVTDDQNVAEVSVSLADGLPPDSSLMSSPLGNNYTEYTFQWAPTMLQQVLNYTYALVFVAEDELEARSVLNVQVQICACQNGGNCTIDGLLNAMASTVILNCECPEGWEGLFCEEDEDGCAQTVCFEGVECTDVPAPGVGGDCGPCPEGYTGDGGKCADIDECVNNTHNCADVCLNLEGSFECACNGSYELLNATHCQDIDECSVLNGGCHQDCTNIDGGFSCSCRAGYQLLSDGTTCEVEPGSVCRSTNNMCEQICVSVGGVETCDCNPGYELADSETCDDVNECEADTPCNQVCINTIGSFSCACNDGYVLLPDGRKCQDINECVVAVFSSFDICDSSMLCVNTEGSFECECPRGTQLIKGSCISTGSPFLEPLQQELEHAAVILDITTQRIFTESIQMIRQLTANAVNSYCEMNGDDCGGLTGRVVTDTDIIITNVDSESDDQLTFYLYAETGSGGVINGEVLLQAIKDHISNFESADFSVSANLLVPEPPNTTEPPSMVAGLSSGAIAGIVIGAVALAVICTVVIVTIPLVVWFKKSSGFAKIAVQEQEEMKEVPKPLENKLPPEETELIHV